MNVTPRTDEVLARCEQRTGEVGVADLIKMHELTKKLEIELNEATKEESPPEKLYHGDARCEYTQLKIDYCSGSSNCHKSCIHKQ